MRLMIHNGSLMSLLPPSIRVRVQAQPDSFDSVDAVMRCLSVSTNVPLQKAVLEFLRSQSELEPIFRKPSVFVNGTARPHASTSYKSPAPVDFPVVPESAFFGREADLKRMTKALKRKRAAIFIIGVGGIGKTTLAARALRLCPGREVVWVPAKTLASFAEFRRRLCECLGIGIGSSDAVVHSHLLDTRRRPLLGIDNVDTVLQTAEDSKSFSAFLSVLGDCCSLVITSRVAVNNQLVKAETIELSRLAPTAAKQLFLSFANTRHLAKDPSLDPFIDDLDGYPLGLVLMAHRFEPGDTLDSLKRRLDSMQADAGEVDIREIIRVSLTHSAFRHSSLSVDAIRLLAWLPAGIPGELPGQILGLRTDEVYDAFRGGLQTSLCQWEAFGKGSFPKGGVFTMLVPVREGFRRWFPHSQSLELLGKLRRWCRTVLEQSSRTGSLRADSVVVNWTLMDWIMDEAAGDEGMKLFVVEPAAARVLGPKHCDRIARTARERGDAVAERAALDRWTEAALGLFQEPTYPTSRHPHELDIFGMNIEDIARKALNHDQDYARLGAANEGDSVRCRITALAHLLLRHPTEALCALQRCEKPEVVSLCWTVLVHRRLAEVGLRRTWDDVGVALDRLQLEEKPQFNFKHLIDRPSGGVLAAPTTTTSTWRTTHQLSRRHTFFMLLLERGFLRGSEDATSKMRKDAGLHPTTCALAWWSIALSVFHAGFYLYYEELFGSTGADERFWTDTGKRLSEFLETATTSGAEIRELYRVCASFFSVVDRRPHPSIPALDACISYFAGDFASAKVGFDAAAGSEWSYWHIPRFYKADFARVLVTFAEDCTRRIEQQDFNIPGVDPGMVVRKRREARDERWWKLWRT